MALIANNAYIKMDIRKAASKESTVFNLTPYFQGRVADSNSTIGLWLYEGPYPMNLMGYSVGFQGRDSAGWDFKIIGFDGKDTHTYDDRQKGRVTFTFPAGTFAHEGSWNDDMTFFYIEDSQGHRVSTINCHLNVYADDVTVAFNPVPLFDGMDKYVKQVKDAADKAVSQINGLPGDLAAVQVKLDSVKTATDTYINLINSRNIPSANDVDAKVNTALDTARRYADAQIAARTATSRDFNSCTTSNTDYVMAASSSNGPNALAGVVSVHGNGTTLFQLFVDSGNDAWTRVRNGSSWTTWNHVTMFY